MADRDFIAGQKDALWEILQKRPETHALNYYGPHNGLGKVSQFFGWRRK